MLIIILEEIINILGTLIAVMAVRYLMGLSSIREDIYMLGYYYGELLYWWKQGQFGNVYHTLRAKRLLNYEDE